MIIYQKYQTQSLNFQTFGKVENEENRHQIILFYFSFLLLLTVAKAIDGKKSKIRTGFKPLENI